MDTLTMKDTSQDALTKESYLLAQKAKTEMLTGKKVNVSCPKCQSHPTVKIWGSNSERITVRCDCGYIACTEFGI